MTDFSTLEADVAAESEVTVAVVALLGDLAQKIADLKAVVPDLTAQAHIDKLAQAVEANKAMLAAAVAANSPAAPVAAPAAPAPIDPAAADHSA